MMDRGIELLAHTLVAVARNPNLTVEQAELHTALVIDQYVVSTFGVDVSIPKASSRIPTPNFS